MTYEVTASRRRPQKFDDLAGQEFTAATLKNAIQTKKIAHAYLFSGPRGCGKTSSARILAKALNCEKGPAAEPCGVCSACVEITRGASLDVIEIDGASNTGVNDVRQIKDEILFPPNSCRYKIYIIDEVHMLSTSAFNALLKTIEEPPPYVVFIFATTELHKVPATIKSRCQQFNFRLIAVERLKELLAEAAAEIGIQADDEALFWIARESTGSARDAYTLFDQVAAFSENHITYEKIRDKLGLVGVERLNELCECCADGKNTAAFEKLDALLSAGVSIEQCTSDLTDYIRSLLLIQSGIQKEALLGQNPARFSQKVLSAWDASRLEQALSLFLQLFRDIRYSVDPRFELELAVVRLCGLKSLVSSTELKAAIDQAKNVLLGGTNAAGAKPAQASTQTAAPFTTETRQNLTAQATQNRPVPAENRQPVPVPTQAHNAVPQFSALNTPPPEAAGESAAHVPEEAPPAADAVTAAAAEPHTSAGQSLAPADLNGLRENAAERIGETSATLAQAFLQTENWQQNGSVIHAEAATAFLKNQLTHESAAINNILSELAGTRLQFTVEMKVPKQDEAPAGPAREVELLCKVFKGTEVGPR